MKSEQLTAKFLVEKTRTQEPASLRHDQKVTDMTWGNSKEEAGPFHEAGGTAQQFRALAASRGSKFSSWDNCLTPAPGELTPSTGLHGHCIHMIPICTCEK